MSKRIDLTGKTFGNWTVVSYATNYKWLCKCKCGVVKKVDGHTLRTGISNGCNSCAAKRNRPVGTFKHSAETKTKLSQIGLGRPSPLKGIPINRIQHNWIDHSNKVYNKWTILRYIKNSYWECRCECGRVKQINIDNITSGKSKGCKECQPFRLFNTNACEYFDRLNRYYNWNLQHALNGGEIKCGSYWLDSYDRLNNIVVEYDERQHYKSGKLKNKDLDRMNYIISTLHCKFYRYHAKDNILYEPVINEFFSSNYV
jgi:hypothetical protein